MHPANPHLECQAASQRSAVCDHSISQATEQEELHPTADLCSFRGSVLLLMGQLSVQKSVLVWIAHTSQIPALHKPLLPSSIRPHCLLAWPLRAQSSPPRVLSHVRALPQETHTAMPVFAARR